MGGGSRDMNEMLCERHGILQVMRAKARGDLAPFSFDLTW